MKDQHQDNHQEGSTEKRGAPDSGESRQAKEPIHQQGGKQLGTGLPGDVTKSDQKGKQ